MRNLNFIRGIIAASALALAATPALAGDEERARAAIAEAQGKIDAAARIDANKVVPEEFARAQASLRLAQEELKSGHEQKAIQAAIASQAAADGAIGRAQQRQQEAAAAQSSNAAAAQQQAADANARAQAAEQAAASAQADAAAARAAPPVIVTAAAPPAPPPATTVTTETTRSVAPVRTTHAAPVRRKTVKRATASRTAPRQTETTRTTVTTTPQ